MNRFLFLALLVVCFTLPHLAAAQTNTNRALMQRLDRMERDMDVIQRQLANNSPSFSQRSNDADANPIMTGNMDGDLLQKMIAMEEEMRDLRGEIEKNSFEISRLQDQIKRMQEDMDFRLQSLESATAPVEPLTGVENTQQETPGPMANADDAYKSETKKNSPSTAGSGKLAKPGTHYGDEPRAHYNEAFRLLSANRYDEAEDAFTSFTTKYPDDPLIGNAYYWLGETYYSKDDFVKAADNFRIGYQKLPNGPKAPDNLLKLAMSLKAMDKNDDACVILTQIEKKFTDDAPANLLQRAKSEKKLMGCK